MNVTFNLKSTSANLAIKKSRNHILDNSSITTY